MAGSSKKSAHALEQGRPDILKRRQAWSDNQSNLDPARLVFIDEIGLSTKMVRRVEERRAVSVVGPACRMGIGKPPPSPARCDGPV